MEDDIKLKDEAESTSILGEKESKEEHKFEVIQNPTLSIKRAKTSRSDVNSYEKTEELFSSIKDKDFDEKEKDEKEEKDNDSVDKSLIEKNIKKKKPKGRSIFNSVKKKSTLALYAEKEKSKRSKDVRSLFLSESLMTNDLKSLQKEKKINDTIVALISFIIIVLCFVQMYQLIESEYYLTDTILTVRTCILILSVPNGKYFTP